MIRVLVMAALLVLVMTPQTVAAAEVADSSAEVRHDSTETGECGTAYFRYH